MVASLTRIYKSTGNVLVLDKAIEKGWITEEDKIKIMLEVDGAE